MDEFNEKTSFDKRIVRYEHIHNVKQEYFQELIKLLHLKDGDKVLDLGCGYGSISREILKAQIPNLNLVLTDNSSVQLERAKAELKDYDFKEKKTTLTYLNDNIVNTNLESNSFNCIIAKMVLHEIPKEKQPITLSNIYNLLKDNGKVVIWDLFLDEELKPVISKIIMKKDSLAGYDTFIRNRNFLTKNKIFDLLNGAGFKNIKISYSMKTRIYTDRRLEMEFKGDVKKLNDWKEYIRNIIPALSKENKAKLDFKEIDSGLSFLFPKKIITAHK